MATARSGIATVTVEKIVSVRENWPNYICRLGQCIYQAENDSDLLRHIYSIHRKCKDFKSPCLFNMDCYEGHMFTSYSGLYKHLKKFHQDFFTTEHGTNIVLF